jgi:four helix bundle protein
MTESVKKFDLEERLIEFAILAIRIDEVLPDNKAGSHIGGQLLRSGTSPALNYGEAQRAESRNDFIHKMKVCLKELRETKISLKIIKRKPLTQSIELIDEALKECDELVAIFVKSIDTAQKNKISNLKRLN